MLEATSELIPTFVTFACCIASGSTSYSHTIPSLLLAIGYAATSTALLTAPEYDSAMAPAHGI